MEQSRGLYHRTREERKILLSQVGDKVTEHRSKVEVRVTEKKVGKSIKDSWFSL